MIKICEICENKFETKSSTRIYCYECSGESTRLDNETRKHQKTILRNNMKKQGVKIGLGVGTIVAAVAAVIANPLALAALPAGGLIWDQAKDHIFKK